MSVRFVGKPRRIAAPSREGRMALTLVNVIAGVLDALDGVEQGQPVLDAIDQAYEKGKRRARALVKADNAPLKEDDE